MAVCLDYQSVYVKNENVINNKMFIASCLFLMSVLIFTVWIKAQKVSLRYEIARAQSKTAQYTTIKKDLSMQLSVVKRYDNLMEVAKNKYGFDIQKKPEIITLEY